MSGGSKVKAYFRQDVKVANPWPVFVFAVSGFAWLVLVGNDRPLLAWAVLLAGGLVIWLLARMPPTKSVRLEESVDLPHDRERVWDLICPAENAPLVDEQIRSGYRVPGSPEGLGERQAFEAVDGSVTIVEVVELAPGHRAVVRRVSPPDVPLRVTHEVAEVLGRPGSVYRQTVEVDLPRGRRLRHGFEKHWRVSTRASFVRIASELSREPWPPPPAAAP